MTRSSEAEAFTDWLSCPKCGSVEVSKTFSNGRLAFRCRDCRHTINRLVGRATFR